MRNRVFILAAALLTAFLIFSLASADSKSAGGTSATFATFTPDQLVWMPAPNSLPAGAMGTVLEGDPSKEGPFTMRVKLPAGYIVPPHWHPGDEHVTVLAGEFYLGMGETYDESSMVLLPVGSFAMMKSGQRHFAHAGKTETILQLNGVGPWGITYVNSKDDPRNQLAGQ